MTLTKRHPTIYFRAKTSIVAEQERDNKAGFCCARCDAAAEHEKSRCASSPHRPRTPALSVPVVPASQAYSGVENNAAETKMLSCWAPSVR